MKTTLALLPFIAAGLMAATAYADGQPVVGVEAVGLEGQKVRYEALPSESDTFVQRIGPHPGETLGWRFLRGEFRIPVVAYDGTADGLTRDGRTLVLIGPRGGRTKFAVLDAPTLRVRKILTLLGTFAFDALSPDGKRLFLIHHTSRRDPLAYEVVSLELSSGRLDSRPIVDPREPDEKMNGHPVTRATSSEGRWAYTLYKGRHHPFVHALDTAQRAARCIDLPWLSRRGKRLWELRLAVRDEGRELAVREPDGETVAVIDMETFEAAPPSAAGAGSLPKTGLSVLALLAAVAGLIYVVRARSRSALS